MATLIKDPNAAFRNKVDECVRLYEEGDNESAHVLEDELQLELLKQVAAGEFQWVKYRARMLINLAETEYARWHA